MRIDVSALFVERGGVYWGMPDVDPWDEDRDARRYDGPSVVVAHPPCARWGRYWSGGPSARTRRRLGDDDGCFRSALASVRRWGGVLEHPEGSHAWRSFELMAPPKRGGWVNADFEGGWTCCVEQGHYGHTARKATWLYVSGPRSLPVLRWGKAHGLRRMDGAFHSNAERREARTAGIAPVERLSRAQRLATPPASGCRHRD